MSKQCNMIIEEVRDVKKPSAGTNVFRGCVLAGWILYSVCFYGKISNGFFVLCNHLLEWWGKCTGTVRLLYQTDEAQGMTAFVMEVIWAGLLLGYFLVQRSRKSLRYLWTKTVILTAIFLLAGGCLYAMGAGRQSRMVADGAAVLWEQAEDICYGNNEAAGLYRGNLYKASEKGAVRERYLQTDPETDPVMLEVVMSHPEDMYLRGFVGEVYEDGQWQTIDNKKKYESGDLFYWLHKVGFYGQTQLGSFVSSSEADAQREGLVSVKNVSADRRYLYAPYEMMDSGYLRPESLGDATMRNALINGETSWQLPVYSGSRTAYMPYLDENVSSDEELHYRQWVYENYLAVPERFSRQFQSVLKKAPTEQGEIAVTEAKELILQYLTDYFQYEEQLHITEAESGREPLMYFLQRSGKGYDVHYASAATLMFRYLGIPARYVEGFLVTKQMAEDAGQSTVISLDAKAGHAWTEIYIDGAGWVPFEATPGYRDKVCEAEELRIDSEGEAEQESEGRGNGQENAQESEPEQKETLPAGRITADEQPEETDFRWIRNVSLCVTLLLLLAVIVTIVVIIATIRKKRKLLWESFCLAKRSDACQNLFAYSMKLLQKKGLRWINGGAVANIDALAQLCTKEYAGKFERIWQLHEEIRFGNTEPEEAVYEEFLQFLEDTKVACSGHRVVQ